MILYSFPRDVPVMMSWYCPVLD